MKSNLTELETIILKMLIAKSIKNGNTDLFLKAKDGEQIIGEEEERLKWIEEHLNTNDV